MRLVVVAAAVCIGGCSLFLGETPESGDGDGDGDVDGGEDGGLGTYAAWKLDIPLADLVGEWTTEAPCVVDTSGAETTCGVAPAPGERDLAFVVAGTVRIDHPIRLEGDTPLVIAANTITVNAAINASAPDSFEAGSLANGPCSAPASAGVDQGASGGGFNGPGALGGASTAAETAGVEIADLAGLQRGCFGGRSSAGEVAAKGGGGLQLIATDSLTVTGTGSIFAHGGGGRGGQQGGRGGGGGGSGGMIVFDSPAISIALGAQVMAFGGGGGTGGSLGFDGQSAATTADASCQAGATVGDAGAGGDGACFDNPAVSGQVLNKAGGGGGGALGYILAHGVVEANGGEVIPDLELVQ